MTDILLQGGVVYDGRGGEPFPADVAITGERITAIGDLTGQPAGRTLNVTGLAVSPGFIDIHTHSDFSLLLNRPMRSSIAQGVTLEVVGNCGVSIGLMDGSDVFAQERRWAERGGLAVDWSRLSGYLKRVEDGGLGCNVMTLAGHGTIRKAVLGYEHRAPTSSELGRMQAILARAMEDGAVGLSTGLEYLPGGYADVNEQASMVQIAREAGGFYATHIRNEGDTLVESVQEAIEVAERAQAPLQLSHHKAEGRQNWGKVAETLPLMQAARGRGLDVLTDQYPYTAFMTGLSVILFPAWANDGTTADTVARVRDSQTRARILAHINAANWDWNVLQVGVVRGRRDAQGLTFAALGAREGKSPAEAALDLYSEEDGYVSAVHFAMSERDVEAILRDPHTMIGSDGVANDPASLLAEDKTHPRSYGTFPRVLSRYVRDKGVVSLAEAVRRMTSLPARRLGLQDRGLLAVGNKADITVFNPATVLDNATFADPHRFPSGITHVIVNGRLAQEGGVQTDVLSGRVLRRG